MKRMDALTNTIKRVRVLDVPVDYVAMSLALKCVEESVTNNKRGNYILAVNAEKFMQLRKDLFLKKIFENAFLLIPDGVGAIWAMRWRYGLRAERVPGIELMQNICMGERAGNAPLASIIGILNDHLNVANTI
ncbi:MAG: hypothetical protein R6T90_02420, partial [Dissulfuribacterales bacterium]